MVSILWFLLTAPPTQGRYNEENKNNMQYENIKCETPQYGQLSKQELVPQKLLKDLQEEQSRLTYDFPICNLLLDDAMERLFSTGEVPGCESYADVLEQNTIKLSQKVIVPVKQYPNINFAAKLLGSKFNSIIHLQNTTKCKITLKGRNSMFDKAKEEELRQTGDPHFKHLNKDLYLEVSTVATPVECYTRIAYALAEIRKYLKPENDHDVSLLTDMESEAVCSMDDKLENNPIMEDEPVQVVFKETERATLVDKPQALQDKSSIINLVDKLIKLLDETVLNPNIQYSNDETMMVSNNIDNLNDFIKSKIPIKTISEAEKSTTRKATKKSTTKRKISTDLTISKNSKSKSEKTKTLKKKQIRNDLKIQERFVGLFYIKDKLTKKIIKRQIISRTALNRCLKRSCVKNMKPDEEVEYKPSTVECLQQTPTELVFEYTPRVIILFLLDSMKNYPILWQFHDKPFNEDYIEAIEDMCQIVNIKWSLNIDSFKMCRSINRILRFYRYLFPFENMEKFAEYFEKCVVFLPSTAIEIPHARCSHCFVCFKEDVELRRHLAEEHKSLKWPYKCQHCVESFIDNEEFEFHQRLPHYVEIFTCEHCNKRYNCRYKYSQHVTKHQQNEIEEPKKHKCEKCGKRFKSYGALHGHKYYHEEKKFKCHLCPKVYYKSTTLSLHLKKHRNQFDVICEVCGKAFLHHRYLNDHMETHNGAQITCRICNLKLRRGNLFRHLRTCHVALEGTIEDTYRAKGHNYKRVTQLSKGIYEPQVRRPRRLEDPTKRQYDCKICNIPFERLKFLKDHNKESHFDFEKFPCKICSVEFKQKHNVKRHYREKHKLHDFQIYSMVDQGKDVDTVMAMKPELFGENIKKSRDETEILSDTNEVKNIAINVAKDSFLEEIKIEKSKNEFLAVF